jgi:hypothetical protein
MTEHYGRNAALVFLAVVLSLGTVYGLWLYNQMLSNDATSNQKSFWQTLRGDLAQKQNALHGNRTR